MKINPIKNELKTTIHKINKSKSNQCFSEVLSNNSLPIATAAALGTVGFSDKWKYFNKTISENYFNLKLNSQTGYPYEADIFQKTSANHLFIGDDVIVTAPTGTGKTAIAEYIMTKNIREGKRTFYTTPLKALSNEKYRDFCQKYGKENVGLLTGDIKINTGAPILLMTTEVYRNMAMSAYFEETRKLPNDLKTVIFDELQYLGDIDRGGVWETSIMLTPKDVQILSLSATAKNAEQINEWVAKIRGEKNIKTPIDGQYKTNPSNRPRSVWVDVPSKNRHVPLEITMEHVIPDGSKKAPQKTKKKNTEDFKKLLSVKTSISTYKHLTNKLQKEEKLPAIYFIFSKKDSRMLLKYFEEYGDTLTTKQEQREISDIISKYKAEGKYLGETLNINAMLKGYSIHNAGMLPSQKELVEELFQKKLLKIAIATETLSAGINMPAKTTVITAVRKPATVSDGSPDGKRNLTPNEFHQMAGRAGRRGIDTRGYCLPLSCNKAQTEIIEDLIASPSNNLESNFHFDFAFVANYISKFENNDEIMNFINKTFYAQKNEYKAKELYKEFKEKRKVLINDEFVDKEGLTLKGELLKHINGYEQIPVINFISSKSLANLSPVELSGIIGGLANIQAQSKLKLNQLSFNIDNENEQIKEKSEILNEILLDYNSKMSNLFNDTVLSVDCDAVNHLYEWAKLNSTFNDSRENWHELYTGNLHETIRDEGTLFKEITMTVDLMKQMINICDCGINNSAANEDKKYYTELKNNLYTALKIIQQEPVV